MNKQISQARRAEISKLLDRFSSNLALYAPHLGDVFLCPLCHKTLPREAIPLGHIDRAHIVPGSLGGTAYTILCKRCNGSLGGGVEGKAHIGDSFFRALIEGGQSPHRSPITICPDDGEEIEVFAYLGSEDGEFGHGITIHFDGDRMPPEVADQLQTVFTEQKVTDFRLSEPRNYDAVVGSKVDVSIAFLAMFDMMGYEFALSQVGLSLRSLLTEPTKVADLTHFSILCDAPITPGKVFLIDSFPPSFGVSMPSCKPLPDDRLLWIPPLPCADVDWTRLKPDCISKSGAKGLKRIDITRDSAVSFYHRHLYNRTWSLVASPPA